MPVEDITRVGSPWNKVVDPVGRVKRSIMLPYLKNPAVIELDVPFNGVVKQIVFRVPVLTNDNTAELKILDEDDNELFASGEKEANKSHLLDAERALCGTITLRIETSGNETEDRTFEVVIYHL
ncbi:MAG: hypothetical protein JW734_06545 [Candidatus Omnitrophica bacterium]|nr:hypothetical protein [Candidatus Omnitrophota bacterium]